MGGANGKITPTQSITGMINVIENLQSKHWCFMKGSTFEECILPAANLGNDANTTAAIYRQKN